MSDSDPRSEILERVAELGGLRPGVARDIARETGVPEAHVYGAASFFHLLDRPDIKLRVCTGLTCQMAGAPRVARPRRRSGDAG